MEDVVVSFTRRACPDMTSSIPSTIRQKKYMWILMIHTRACSSLCHKMEPPQSWLTLQTDNNYNSPRFEFQCSFHLHSCNSITIVHCFFLIQYYMQSSLYKLCMFSSLDKNQSLIQTCKCHLPINLKEKDGEQVFQQ